MKETRVNEFDHREFWVAVVKSGTGHCYFCGSELIDERSTKAGHGPVCAQR